MEDLTGKVFGKWKVAERSWEKIPTNNRGPWWNCQCRCGATKVIQTRMFKGGHIPRCPECGDKVYEKKRRERIPGAVKKEISLLDDTKRKWKRMIDRCTVKDMEAFKHYGGRGITYDESWSVFEYFLVDMGFCPPGYTLDRIDSNKGYSKENCRWATWNEQNRNTRRCKRWFIKGMVFESAAQAGKYFGVSDVAIHYWCVDKNKPDCYNVPLYDGNGKKFITP